MKKADEYWTTKDGRKILLTEMSNQHLLNAHRMVREKQIDVDNFQHNAFVFAPPEDTIAYDDFEDALEDSYDRQSALYTRASTLGAEIERRSLEPLEPRVKVERMKVKSIEYFEHGKIVEFDRV